ncbi:MAG: hypothetical protein SF052_18235 [Bacteroidia bacterium]|nr:hypothetical protein [Bacteroidia bacterium]
MKKTILLLLVLTIAQIGLLLADSDKNWTQGFVTSNPEIQSVNAMAFGPEGILFLGDSKSASIFAVTTDDQASRSAAEGIDLNQIDKTIAALLGTTADKISIQDMAVHPASQAVYIAVHTEDGKPILFKTFGKTFEHVPLDKVNYSKTPLINAVAEDAKDNRGRSMRQWAISDLAFYGDKVMVSGLSNEEFGSTFRSIPFPFSDNQTYASLEIYHAAHGKFETHSPIKTFLPYELNGAPHLIASYTCTPLVVFPLSEMKQGQLTKGKTVAELGSSNTPLDIISFKKGDKSYLLMANSNRALMKIDTDQVAAYKDYLTTPVEENFATAGVPFVATPYVNVQQLADFNDQYIAIIQRKANGDLALMTLDKKRL